MNGHNWEAVREVQIPWPLTKSKHQKKYVARILQFGCKFLFFQRTLLMKICVFIYASAYALTLLARAYNACLCVNECMQTCVKSY